MNYTLNSILTYINYAQLKILMCRAFAILDRLIYRSNHVHCYLNAVIDQFIHMCELKFFIYFMHSIICTLTSSSNTYPNSSLHHGWSGGRRGNAGSKCFPALPNPLILHERPLPLDLFINSMYSLRPIPRRRRPTF